MQGRMTSMTRENKLALVVGFALILIVGILVSDHFSTASRQQAADVARVQDPLRSGTRANRVISDFVATNTRESRLADHGIEDPLARPDLPALDPVDEGAAATGGAGTAGGPTVIEMGNGRSGARSGDPSTGGASRPDRGAAAPGGTAPPAGLSRDPGQSPHRFHHVARGESLASIARTYYSDPALAAALARHNGITDPNRIHIGRRLMIPEAHVLRGEPAPTARATETARTPAPPPATPTAGGASRSAPPPAAVARHEVREGETLSSIARKYLGSAGRYRVIFEANRDLLENEDDLRPGMVLKIPAAKS